MHVISTRRLYVKTQQYQVDGTPSADVQQRVLRQGLQLEEQHVRREIRSPEGNLVAAAATVTLLCTALALTSFRSALALTALALQS
jgi:hypothetical protein